jgi:hypothetical protein
MYYLLVLTKNFAKQSLSQIKNPCQANFAAWSVRPNEFLLTLNVFPLTATAEKDKIFENEIAAATKRPRNDKI